MIAERTESNPKEAALAIIALFKKRITFGYLDLLPLDVLAGNTNLKYAIPCYDRNEDIDSFISLMLWVVIFIAVCSINPVSESIKITLIMAIIAAFFYRVNRLGRAFVKVLRAHPDDVKLVASHWGDCPSEREAEMESILKFVEHGSQSPFEIFKTFLILFMDIKNAYCSETDTKRDINGDYKKQFCQDACDVKTD